ncbi:MAG: hypothetical protein GX663_08410 [Clostridiales bacterium]|nr:hypothetical protein [Clostridiales bacterium]
MDSKKRIIKFAGAFVAWVIGSGFATGQELLQFFSSYGYWSYGAIIINLVGFVLVGPTILRVGYNNKDDENFQQLKYFCGDKLGAVYSWLIPITLVAGMTVLISGAGATLSEYYGVNHYIGAAIMSAMVLGAYLIGFNRLVRIISLIGPIIIIFTLVVGLVTVCRDFESLADVPQHKAVLSQSQSSINWVISAVLYVSYNHLCGSVYYSALGATGTSEREVRIGAVAGAIALIAAITVMNAAILSNAGNTAALDIPTLFLAKKISFVFGMVFSIILILGIFSSCSAMMWTVCSKFTVEGTEKSRIFAGAVAGGTFLLGLLPFSDLISILYPFIGYAGLIYMICVIRKRMKL